MKTRVAAFLGAIVALSCGKVCAGEPQILSITFQSPLLTQFFEAPVTIEAHVLLPDSYYKEPARRYPVVYVVPAFNGTDGVTRGRELEWQRPMRALGREFIIVFLQGMVGINDEIIHQQFADSSNIGPWGSALADEFVPETDKHFRTIASGDGRYLFGHSSGGWSVLWLQITYPELFNGVWALSPDPVDFHDFFGIDITTASNFYVDADGRPFPFCREGRNDFSTLRDFVEGYKGCERAVSAYQMVGKPWNQRQLDTYDDVFSPRRSDGTPAALFDRKTGAIDRAVAAYWEEHFDLTHVMRARWPTIGAQLFGKIHVVVGGADNFHLDGPVRLMQRAAEHLGANAEIEVAPGLDHWEVYGWHGGMIGYALAEMSQRLAQAQVEQK